MRDERGRERRENLLFPASVQADPHGVPVCPSVCLCVTYKHYVSVCVIFFAVAVAGVDPVFFFHSSFFCV